MTGTTLLLVALLVGCTTPRVLDNGPDRYQLRQRVSWYTVTMTYAPIELGRSALQRCTKGYERLAEWTEEGEDGLFLIWNVRCEV